MKSRTRQFVVEVKNKRKRGPDGPASIWGAVPLRPDEDRRDAACELEAPARSLPGKPTDLWSDLAPSGRPPVSQLIDLAASVFGPKPEASATSARTVAGTRPTGRVLPALPPSEPALAESIASAPPPRAIRVKAPTRASTRNVESPPPATVAVPLIDVEMDGLLPEMEPCPVKAPRRLAPRKPGAVLRAGDAWKRRRLPPALW